MYELEGRLTVDWHPWIVYAHVLGAFAFAAGHGVAATMAFRLRSERDPSRIAAILDYSLWQLSPRSLMSIGFIVLFLSGIAAGFTGGYWGRLWIWVAIVLLVVITGLMTPVAAGHYNKVRAAIGQKLPRDKTDAPPPEPLPPDQLEPLLMASTPWILVGLGGIGFAAILLLMMFKPF
jgi:hypothetical protein